MYLQTIFGAKEKKRKGSSAVPVTPVAELEPVPAPLAVALKPLRNTPAEARPQPQPSGPRIKTYVAESVPHAMTLARREMGEDAILIQTRRRETIDVSKQFEVTFGIVPDAGPPSRKPSEIAETRLQGRDHGRAVGSRFRSRPPTGIVAPRTGRAADHAAAIGLREIHPRRRTTRLRRKPTRRFCATISMRNSLPTWCAGSIPDAKSAVEALCGQLAAQIRTDSTIAQDGKAVILMGPPACGKTTALIKLAVEYGLKLGNPIEFFSLTKGKTSVDRTLETMTGILGVPCEALADAAALVSALARPRAAGTLVLVDANGYGLRSGRMTKWSWPRCWLPAKMPMFIWCFRRPGKASASGRPSIVLKSSSRRACCSPCWIRPPFMVP